VLQVLDFGVFIELVFGGDSGWKINSPELIDELCELGVCSRAVEYL
jgi:hypothetical protein